MGARFRSTKIYVSNFISIAYGKHLAYQQPAGGAGDGRRQGRFGGPGPQVGGNARPARGFGWVSGSNWWLMLSCTASPGGETGRRTGLKIGFIDFINHFK